MRLDAGKYTGLLKGRGCLIIGSGPSIAGQVAMIRRAQAVGIPTLGVNLTFLQLFGLMFGSILDVDWLRKKRGLLWRHVGVLFTPEERSRGFDRYNLVTTTTKIDNRRCDARIGVSAYFGNGIFDNHCGGGYAISVAWALGADPILLAGYDCKPAADGREHWYDQPDTPRQGMIGWMLNNLETLAPYCGRRVINCSAETALVGFPRSELERELGCINFS